jgi:hypothetical protein
VRAVVWLVVCLASPSAAQRDSSAAPSIPDTADALVLDHDFIAGAGEFVRVFLQANQVYRAELSTPDVTIGIRAPFRRVQLPRVYPVTNASTASGSSVVELYPYTKIRAGQRSDDQPAASRCGLVSVTPAVICLK